MYTGEAYVRVLVPASDEQTHVVQDYHGNTCAPAVLVQLEAAIDAAARSDQWVLCDKVDVGCCNPTYSNPLLAGTLPHCD
jgi:hypothetical protein